jgi:hyperosmotically inducible protein
MRARISIVLLTLAATFTLFACSTPDVVITTEVKAKMVADSVVRPYHLEVETKNGQVTLTGNIDSQEAKDRALQIASQTGGVTNVVDMISVKTAATHGDAPDPDRTVGEHIDDATITARVKTRLLEDPLVKGMDIDVDTRVGVVYLTGTVQKPDQKDAAIQIAKNTRGVKDVQANISVSATTSAGV